MRLLFIFLLASMGIDRIDLAGGILDFRLTPYIAMGSVLIVYFFTIFVFIDGKILPTLPSFPIFEGLDVEINKVSVIP